MKLSAQLKKWQAQSDADTLARYQEIMSDASRRKAAVAAKQESERLEKAASNMKLAASGKFKK